MAVLFLILCKTLKSNASMAGTSQLGVWDCPISNLRAEMQYSWSSVFFVHWNNDWAPSNTCKVLFKKERNSAALHAAGHDLGSASLP